MCGIRHRLKNPTLYASLLFVTVQTIPKHGHAVDPIVYCLGPPILTSQRGLT